MRTTIDINDAILRQLKDLAARSGKPLRAVVGDALQLGLSSAAKPRPKRGFRVQTHPLGLKAAFRGVSLNQFYDQIESERSVRRP